MTPESYALELATAHRKRPNTRIVVYEHGFAGDHAWFRFTLKWTDISTQEIRTRAGMRLYRISADKLAETWVTLLPIGSAWPDAVAQASWTSDPTALNNWFNLMLVAFHRGREIPLRARSTRSQLRRSRGKPSLLPSPPDQSLSGVRWGNACARRSLSALIKVCRTRAQRSSMSQHSAPVKRATLLCTLEPFWAAPPIRYCQLRKERP